MGASMPMIARYGLSWTNSQSKKVSKTIGLEPPVSPLLGITRGKPQAFPAHSPRPIRNCPSHTVQRRKIVRNIWFSVTYTEPLQAQLGPVTLVACLKCKHGYPFPQPTASRWIRPRFMNRSDMNCTLARVIADSFCSQRSALRMYRPTVVLDAYKPLVFLTCYYFAGGRFVAEELPG